MAEHVCTGDHDRHICKLADAKQSDEICWMITEPKFMCYKCGRAAKKAENLSNPVNVDMGMYM